MSGFFEMGGWKCQDEFCIQNFAHQKFPEMQNEHENSDAKN